MKAEDIEKLIQFQELPLFRPDQLMIKATLTLHAAHIVTNEALEGCKDPACVKRMIKTELTEIIMRRLYDDQRQALFPALQELFKADPMSYEELHKAKDNLLQVVMRQPHV